MSGDWKHRGAVRFPHGRLGLYNRTLAAFLHARLRGLL